ncbi:hypothetical protein MNBD_GAMMA17-1039 [hydrothermal vent metagenome]|uniref:VTT domain-containing protein n=1 Tax=hydrothermal vent metagenome TaxID=652676 RepID=A0A3B0ZNU2_9ZZZZ
MKTLIKLFLLLVACFASIFVVIKLTGLVTIDDVKGWLALAETISPLTLAAMIVLLLLVDLVISIPTLIVCMLSGYFLGFGLGAFASMVGLSLVGVVGYTMSRLFGPTLLMKVVKCEDKIEEMANLFHRHGFIMILVSRAIPMVPESAACMSGITKMPLQRFALAWMLSSCPYALMTAYAGSVSTAQDPAPAIVTAIGMMIILWAGVTFFSRYQMAGKIEVR